MPTCRWAAPSTAGRGSWPDGTLGASGAFTNNGYIALQDSNVGEFQAIAGKLATIPNVNNPIITAGGNVFYLGGHQYKGAPGDKNATIEQANGMQMALNAVFVPADRPAACGFDIPPKVQIVKNTVGANGTFSFTVTGGPDQPPPITTNGNTGSALLTGVAVDQTIYITENPATGWQASGPTCTNISSSRSVNVVEKLASGDDIQCIFNNVAQPVMDVTKEVFSVTGPVSGEYTVTYTIKVTNSGPGAGTYTLTDTPGFATGLNFVTLGTTVTPSGGGSLDPSFSPYTPDGTAKTYVTGKNLPGLTTHTYTVAMKFTVGSPSVNDLLCDPAGVVGKGLFNKVNITGSNADEATACANAPGSPNIGVVKTFKPPLSVSAAGVYTATYEVKVTNSGSAAGTYTLTDALYYVAGLTFETDGATVTTSDGDLSGVTTTWTPANGSGNAISSASPALRWAQQVHRIGSR